MDTLQLYVNEKKVIVDSSNNGGAEKRSDLSLAGFLRNELNLTGTKISCGVGGCGSCTVLISRYFHVEKVVKHHTVNACLTPFYSLDGCHILTVEGLSNSHSYHEIQEALAVGNATQCGYCSPGLVMSLFGMEVQSEVENCNDSAHISKVKTALEGNLCRCTGYRPILEAFYKRSKCETSCKKASEGCCKGSGEDIEDAGTKLVTQKPQTIENLRQISSCGSGGVFKKIEEILKMEHFQKPQLLKTFQTKNSSWAVPTSIPELKKILEEISTTPNNYKIVSGATSEEFWKYLSLISSQIIMDVSKIKEMRCVDLSTDYILKLGASLTLGEMEEHLKIFLKNENFTNSQKKVLTALLQMTEVYGSNQIRQSATIGGSLSVTSAASDLQTAFKGFNLTANFVEGFPNILQSINIPLLENVEHAWYGKIRRRKDFDLALMNVAVIHSRNEDGYIEISACFGGLLLKRFLHKYTYCQNQSQGFMDTVKEQLLKNICPEQIKLNSSTKCFAETSAHSLMKKSFHAMEEERNISALSSENHSRIFRSTRILTKAELGQSERNLVHREVPHSSAIKHVTGEAKYCDDIPKFGNELELAFVLSTKAHAKILKVDYSKALEMEGVVGVVSHEDVLPGKNKFGLVEQDEEIFASEKVTAQGQIIAGVLANSREVAREAAKLVAVEYEPLLPVILTNEDSIKHNAFYKKYDLKMTKGNCHQIFDKGFNELTGEVKVGSQEHFYMETQSCIVMPSGEEGELEIISSTQNPTGIQMQTALVLDIPANRIVVKVKRVGGGFGGKESRCLMIALPTAIAAQKFGRPVRCILSREMDMMITGHRATYLTRHKIAFDDKGKLLALEMQVFIGAGNSIDVSMAEIERVALNIDNAYNIPHMDFKGYVCKSNLSSNTVFRGTGGPQATFLMENIIDMVATYLKKEPVDVRSLQIYREEDFTPYGQSLKDSTVLKCWNECLHSSNYIEKKKEVEKFNQINSHKKRGISVNPINYGVGYTVQHLNQGAALLHIYTDGTVLLSHSGVEIGQGVHTKMIQIATSILGIPGGKIRIMETATDKIPNSTPSSASMTTDLSGGAVMDACQQLSERLKPYKIKYPDDSWEDIVMKAYLNRVSLSATGFYKVPEMGDEWDAGSVKGNPWSYFSSGAACTVVELDCLTGQFEILSTDIVMDVGKSLNPSIDVGQIEGAFMQGVGLFLLEELVYDENGKLITSGPLTYKIPTANDAPHEFNVSFLMGPGNPKAVYSSKAIGEPPILLATSVFFAVKDAIRKYRLANGKDINFRLDSPATVEKILLACHTIFDQGHNTNLITVNH